MRLTKKTLLYSTVLAFLFLMSFSCKKEKSPDPPVCVGGTGGSTTLVVTLKHHSLLIPSDSIYPDTVWVKYDAVNAGSGYEGMILQSIANTFGGYFNTDKVILTIDNQLYESGHFAFQEGEYITVNLDNTVKLL